MYIESILLFQYFSSKEFIVGVDHMLTIMYNIYLVSCGFLKLEFLLLLIGPTEWLFCVMDAEVVLSLIGSSALSWSYFWVDFFMYLKILDLINVATCL